MADKKTYQATVAHLARVKAERETLLAQRKELDRKFSLNSKTIRELEAKIESMKVRDLTVSEHAFLRFFERVLGYDLRQIEVQMVSPSIKELYAKLGDGEYPGNGFKVRIRNGTVITVIGKDEA